MANNGTCSKVATKSTHRTGLFVLGKVLLDYFSSHSNKIELQGKVWSQLQVVEVHLPHLRTYFHRELGNEGLTLQLRESRSTFVDQYPRFCLSRCRDVIEMVVDDAGNQHPTQIRRRTSSHGNMGQRPPRSRAASMGSQGGGGTTTTSVATLHKRALNKHMHSRLSRDETTSGVSPFWSARNDRHSSPRCFILLNYHDFEE